jgi:hypothetical protein
MENCPANTNSNTKLPPLSNFDLPMAAGFSLLKKEREELRELPLEKLKADSTPTPQKLYQTLTDAIISKEIKEAKEDKEIENGEKKTEGRWTDEEHARFIEGKLNYRS